MPPLEPGSNLSRAFAEDNISFVRKDWPRWRDWTAAHFSVVRRKVVVDDRRILEREAMKGVELIVLGG
jgi:hypothetical protein